MNTRLIVVLWGLICTITITIAFAGLTYAQTSIDQEKAGLRRGGTLFMEYCSGCHSLRYMRYNQLANILGVTSFNGTIDRASFLNKLVVSKAKNYDTLKVSMPKKDARKWFGAVPPDLSLIAREKSPDWIIAYMKNFYEDSSRPSGSNNYLVPGVAMPNVLFPLRGRVVAIRQNKISTHTILYLQQIGHGQMSPEEFDYALQDLVDFLSYVAEPERKSRYWMGVSVLLFLVVFLLLAWKLNNLYWQKWLNRK